jgi:hypothetical protein
MICESLSFLKNCLNTYLSTDGASEDKVVFLDGQNMEPLTFKLGAVSILLINIEEENTLRRPDPYTRVSSNGEHQKVQPDIRLNLYVLFVAHFNDYGNSLHYLSQIIRYFQSHRVFDHHNAPELNENIEKLIVELITLPFSEQNEVWNALRVTYHPSVLYKVKMLVFQDEEVRSVPEITEKDINIRSTS